MAAIIPHLEQPRETTPLERQFYRCIAGEPNLNGAFADGSGCPAPAAIVTKNHQELLAMVYVRHAVEASLVGRRFVVQNGKPQIDKDGREKIIDPSTIYLVLDGPIGEGPPWNPAASPSARSYNLLTWTSKMNCPSFSIPAGAPAVGGTCPGATAGQSAVPHDQLISAGRIVKSVIGEDVDISRSVCAFCYATGGQYGTGGVQFAQALRHVWVRQAILERIDGPFGPSTLFIETMVAAISNAHFYLQGGRISKDETGGEHQSLPPEFSGRRFFRIHDSGDFFSPEYLAQWKVVCDRLPDITFWAPSRVWALGKPWIDAVNRINGDARNLMIRPSAYHIDGPCPVDLGPGWVKGSTVYSKEAGGYGTAWTWACDAYSHGSNRTCRGAMAPPGMGDPNTGRGCRACWIAPDLTPNYSPH